jgi:nucleoside-diphosphate-sugar epimerase
MISLGSDAGVEKILLTGAGGYVGGKLRRRFEERGAAVRCLARNPDELRSHVKETSRVVAGDVLDRSRWKRRSRGWSRPTISYT